MNRLLKVNLIKSAKFEYTEIDIDGNTLFIGANGAGKTTLLRAILYFYTANSASLGIKRSIKSSFLEYYFEYENSYIVYTFKKDNRYILAIAYKLSSIYFRFCMFNEMPSIEDIFIENNKPLLPQELFLKLKEKSLVSKAFTPSEYIKVLYGQKNKEFSLFSSKDYDGFRKTLSNIFINSKVDSETIKKVLISSLEQSQNIDLDWIKRHLNRFNTIYEDILRYEKNTDTIKKIVKNIDELNNIKDNLKLNLSVIEYSKKVVDEKLLSIKEKITLEINNLNSLKKQLEDEERLFDKRNSKLVEQIGVKKSKLKEIEVLEEKYKKLNIEFKIKEFAKLDILKLNLDELTKQIEFLTLKQNQLKQAYENRIAQIENNFQKLQNDLTKQKFEEIDKLNVQKIKINETKQKELNKIENEFALLKEDILKQKTKILIEKNNLENQINNLKQEKFIFDDEKLQTLNIEKNNIENEIKYLLSNIENLDKELKSLEDSFIEKEKNINKDFEAKLKELKLQKEKFIKLLNPNKNSLLSKIYLNNLEINKYIYFLKDEVLDKEFDIDIKSSSNSIFEVNIKNFNAPDFNIEIKLKEIDENIKILTKEHKESIEKLKDEFSKQEKKLLKNKKNLNDLLTKNKQTILDINSKLNFLNIQKEEKRQEFESKKTEKQKEFEAQKEEILSKLKEVEDNIKNLNKNKESKLTSIKIFYTKELNKIDSQIENIDKKYQSDIDNLMQQKQKELKNQESIYFAKLKNENIDIEKIKKYQNDISSINQKIKTIESYQIDILKYENDKEFISTKPILKKELKEFQNSLDSLKNNFYKIKQELNLKIEAQNSIINDLEKEQSKIIEKIDEFLEFENSSIFNNLKNLILFDNIEEFFDLKEIKNNLILLSDRYNNILQNIDKNINKIGIVFDSTLEIKRDIDILKTANNLKDFFENNKIKYFKNMQIESINQIVSHLNEKYQLLMSQSYQIQKLISKITKLFFEVKIGVIDEISLRYSKSSNKTLEILEQIKLLSDESISGFGISLFNDGSDSKKMLALLRDLMVVIEDAGFDSINLEDSFVLEFRVVENQNDSKYQTSLDNIGSNGTDVLVKSMIYIAMVSIFKNKISKDDLIVHTILDEIGILSQRYLKALIEFANKYGIYFVNGAPDEKLIGTYKKVYLIQRDKNISKAMEIISQ